MITTGIRKLLTITILGAFALATTPSFAEDVKVPQTAADHEALAKTYQEKAASYRKEAADHRAMAEAYKKRYGNPGQEARGQKNPHVVKMESHCAAIAAGADKLATEAEKAADFHKFRANEIRGK